MHNFKPGLPEHMTTPVYYANRRPFYHPNDKHRVVSIHNGQWVVQKRLRSQPANREHDEWSTICRPFRDRGEAISKLFSVAAIDG
jgi:hypothetical protein